MDPQYCTAGMNEPVADRMGFYHSAICCNNNTHVDVLIFHVIEFMLSTTLIASTNRCSPDHIEIYPKYSFQMLHRRLKSSFFSVKWWPLFSKAAVLYWSVIALWTADVVKIFFCWHQWEISHQHMSECCIVICYMRIISLNAVIWFSVVTKTRWHSCCGGSLYFMLQAASLPTDLKFLSVPLVPIQKCFLD